jgi:uncharacterized membrane protein YfhO
MMWQAHIPPGRHVIQLSYWPKEFTDGIVVAALAVVGLVAIGIVTRRRALAPRIGDETTETDRRST